MILTSSGIRVHKSLFKFEGNLWFGTLRRRYVGEAEERGNLANQLSWRTGARTERRAWYILNLQCEQWSQADLPGM